MRQRRIPKGTKITGEGKGFPYEVISDLPEVGLICNDASGSPIIVRHDELEIKSQIVYTLTMKKPPEPDKPVSKKEG